MVVLLTKDQVFLIFQLLQIHDLMYKNEVHELSLIVIILDKDQDIYQHRIYVLLHHYL
jgi:hypothetical protein